MRAEHYPSLNGLRGLSILLVLYGHVERTDGFPLPLSTSLWGDLGYLGVKVFFVISGFLITGLLLDEHAQHGRISLRRFYARRTLRIFPAFYSFIVVAALLSMYNVITLPWQDLIIAATYIKNLTYGQSWYVEHTWSLAVEEQFYLLWPMLIIILRPHWRCIVPLAVVALAPWLRLYAWRHPEAIANILPDLLMPFPHALIAGFDAIAMGCLLAFVKHWLVDNKKYLQFTGSVYFWLLPILGISMNRWLSHPIGHGVWMAETILNVTIAICIERFIRLPNRRSGQFLNSSTMVWIGTLSYSIYLWQQLFLNRHTTSWIASFPQNLVFVFTVACVSYYGIERTFLKIKQRFQV